jgi:hypothetical protein
MTGLEPFICSGIITGFKLCRHLWKKYKRRHTSAHRVISPLEIALERGQGDIEKKWNKLVEPIGKRFALGDGKYI